MCGIVGLYNCEEASNMAYLALYALQHRGQEGAGIVSSDGTDLHARIGLGEVSQVFSEKTLTELPGRNAIGHVRYSTTGTNDLENCQPITANYAAGKISIAHNGNLINSQSLRETLEAKKAIFQSTMDTETIVHLIAHSQKETFNERLFDALSQIRGAYSLVLLTENKLIGVRDPYGWRPLVLGKKGKGWVLASETSALDLLDAKFEREIEPGEVVIIDKAGLQTFTPLPIPKKKAMCIFEFIYFARPNSFIFKRDVYEMRKGFGHQLAKEHPVEADVVIPVPDSGMQAALGYAEESGIPYQIGLIRNHYVGRTFIEPSQAMRDSRVKLKLHPVKYVLKGKRVVVVDDSIVRGTTSKRIVKMLREAGAKEVHMRVSSPPTTDPCFYGIDTPSKSELIASNMNVEETREFIGADSLKYLSPEGLYWFEKNPGEWFCDACFTGNYPVAIEESSAKLRLVKKPASK